MTETCVFCGIAAKEIPADMVFETDEVVCFSDLNPQAPTHVLVIPKRHITDASTIEDADAEIVGKLFLAARAVAHTLQLDDGYRLVANVGEAAGNSVPHLHIHVLGGRALTWPPG